MRIFKVINLLTIIITLLFSCIKEQTNELLSKPCIIPDVEKILIDNSNTLGFECFKYSLAFSENNENIFVSPIGISLTINSLIEASNNNTNRELKNCLRINNLKDSLIDAGFNHLNHLYSEIDYSSKLNNLHKIAISAESLIEKKFEDFDLNREYLEILHDENAGFIENINNDYSHNSNKAFQILNTINFSSKSKYQIRVEESPFYNSPENINFVEMVVSKAELNYYSDQTVKAVELPLGRGNFNILLISPQNSETLKDLCKKLDNSLLRRIKKKFRPQIIEVILPKIELKSIKTLKNFFSENKMNMSFNETSADFSRLSKQKNLYLSDFEHIVDINISGSGLEKSDYSFQTSENDNVKSMLIDHPFIFIIYEKYSEGILFIGKIATL